jgi:hypothetical protein
MNWLRSSMPHSWLGGPNGKSEAVRANQGWTGTRPSQRGQVGPATRREGQEAPQKTIGQKWPVLKHGFPP